MISNDMEQRILRLYAAERWKVGTIARQLYVHHNVVERVIRQAGLAVDKPPRPSIADPYVPFMIETLEKYPKLTASRLYEMVKERGYPGAPDHFRAIVARYRPKPAAEAFLRRTTLPGEEAQMDWGSFGSVQVGRAIRKLWAFVMVLSFSRLIFARFSYGARMDVFLRGHVEAFQFFEGVPRTILYDNLKSAVLERRGDAIRFNPALLALAGHCHFEPRPVAVASPEEKGRVERAIRYLRTSFFAARQFDDLDDLNAQARLWCQTKSCERPCPQDRSFTVGETFEQEKILLMELPSDHFPCDEQVAVKAGKTPYVRFDLNDYSVPHTYVRRALTVLASEHVVRVLDGPEVIATHKRSYDKAAQVEEPGHVQGLIDVKAAARKSRAMDRLAHSVPNTTELLIRLANNGGNLGSATAALVRMLDTHGAVALESAVAEALEQGANHPRTVRRILDQRQKEAGITPLPVALPDNERVRNLHVKPHDLASYDDLGGKEDNDDD